MSARSRRSHRLDRHLVHVVRRRDLAARIEGRRLDTQHDLAAVRLRQHGEEAQQPRDRPDADQQHAGGVGIEGARVTDLLRAEDAAQLGDDVVRCPARLLVDDDEAVRPHRRCRWRSTSSTRAAIRSTWSGRNVSGRRPLHPRLSGDRRLERDPMRLEGGEHLVVTRLVERRVDVHRGVAQVGLDLDAHHGDQLEPFDRRCARCSSATIWCSELVEARRARVGMCSLRASTLHRSTSIHRSVASTTSTSGNDHTNRSTASSTSRACDSVPDTTAMAKRRSLPQVLMVDLGRARPPNRWRAPSHDRPDDRSFLLQRVDVGQVQLDGQRTHDHGYVRADLALLVGLDDVALLEVLEVGQADAALEAGLHLAHVVLEALERRDRALPDDRALAEEAHLRAAGDRAGLARSSRRSCPTRGTEKISRTSASPVTTSSNSGASRPSIAFSMSSMTW